MLGTKDIYLEIEGVVLLRGTPEKSGKSVAEVDVDKYFPSMTPDKGGREGTGKVHQGDSSRRRENDMNKIIISADFVVVSGYHEKYQYQNL